MRNCLLKVGKANPCGLGPVHLIYIFINTLFFPKCCVFSEVCSSLNLMKRWQIDTFTPLFIGVVSISLLIYKTKQYPYPSIGNVEITPIVLFLLSVFTQVTI
jgi:hypothetical protein